MISGEYWIDESGNLLYADDYVGDYNHEAYVVDALQHSIADAFNKNYDNNNWNGLKKEIFEDIAKERPEYEEMDMDEAIVDALKKEGHNNAEEVFEMANGNGDPRKYAMQYWGWKRVVGHDIETWTLTPKDLEIIKNGLMEILYEEGHEEESEDEDDEEFYISTYQGPSRTITLGELKGNSVEMKPTSKFDFDKEIATKQARQRDVDSVHPYYQTKTFPLGDSVLGIKTFKEWLLLKETGTSTANVATFQFPVFSGLKKRKFPKVQ